MGVDRADAGRVVGNSEVDQKRAYVSYLLRSQFATALGSNLTHVPIRKQGMRPTFASLKTVIRDTDSNSASSTAVRA